MALSEETLASELEAMVPVGSLTQGIDNFAAAFENYFFESEAEKIPGAGTGILDKALLSGATAALKSAMAPVTAADAFAGIQAGIIAFWGVVSTSAATIWVTVPPIAAVAPPLGLSGIAAELKIVGDANVAGEKSLEESAAAMAVSLHSLNLGAIATDTTAPTPLTFPII